MATLTVTGNRDQPHPLTTIEDHAERMRRVARLDRSVKNCYAAAQGMVVAALGTFPIVAASHIDLEPQPQLTLDLASLLWMALLPGALACGLSGLRLSRARRRMMDATPQS